jgi:hypothetical protein
MHPARPHPLVARAAARPFIRTSARRRAEGRRPRLALRQDHFAATRLAFRTRPASRAVRANRFLTSRIAHSCTVIKTRVVRQQEHARLHARPSSHLPTAGRASPVTGRRRGCSVPETEDADVKVFAERCQDDRHHFRFIVSPEDASDMADLKSFTRDLDGADGKGSRHEARLGRCVDHWNTDNPHVHHHRARARR